MRFSIRNNNCFTVINNIDLSLKKIVKIYKLRVSKSNIIKLDNICVFQYGNLKGIVEY